MEFLIEYGVFLAKAVTIVLAVIVIIGSIAAAGSRNKREQKGQIELTALHEKYHDFSEEMQSILLDKEAYKVYQKKQKKADKLKAKQEKQEHQGKQGYEAKREKRVYVCDFDGDVKASEVKELRECITSILLVATKQDEVVVRLESPGGIVHGYGLAASQLERVRSAGIPLTVIVDKVAASGEYLMACVADRILAAPFAVIGSIGVVAQLPNFNKVLKKNNVEYEMLTAGDYKRTLTMFGENTEQGRAKMRSELEEIHELFKGFIEKFRTSIDIKQVATGETWYGEKAKSLNLIDDIQTSDDYLLQKVKSEDAKVFEVRYEEKKSMAEKLGFAASAAIEKSFDKLAQLGLQRNV